MGQALYRKYRSKTLSEIIGQEHITETLQKALQNGRISHAYLFTGPRGVGKTSIARILAYEINGLAYAEDSMHIDIIEIDAASNNGVEDIRDLREKAYVAPSSAPYKVYIIDEVHMLSKPAFNALLKILEEPPAHIIFILATTDAHKLPETIVSRTQRYTFKPVPAHQVVDHLRTIADNEQILIDDAALNLLAVHGDGSFRDSISMLDQASSSGEKVTLGDVQRLLGIPPETGIVALAQAISTYNGPDAIKQLNVLYDQGFQATSIAKAMSQIFRQQILDGNQPTMPSTALFTMLAKLLGVPIGHDPERLLEIIILEATGRLDAHVPIAAPVSVPVAEPAPQIIPSPTKQKQTVDIPPPIVHKAKPAASPAPAAPVAVPPTQPAVASAAGFDPAMWPDVLTALKQKYNTLYGVVRMATPTFDGKEMELAFAFAFHQKRLTDSKNKKILADIMEELSGQAMHITCVVRKDTPTVTAAHNLPAKASPAPDLGAISDIFGGAEIIK